MKVNPYEPIATVISEQLGQTIYNGLDIRTHMAIEFTKALIPTFPKVNGNVVSSHVVKKAIEVADELIKQLNQEHHEN